MASSDQAYFKGKDMFLLPDGSTYHVGIKAGDVYPRILTVGSKQRAAAIAKFFDSLPPVKEIHSSREYHTYTGHYKGVGISIVAIGMGAPMMDFFVREVSFILPEPLAIIRLGTCGLFNSSLEPGTVVTCGKGSHYIFSNYTYHYGSADGTKEVLNSTPYICSAAVEGNQKLNEQLVAKLNEHKLKFHDGLNASAETFYACQGRVSEGFSDQNDDLLEKIMSLGIDSVEMESHQLLHLTKMRTIPCYAAAAAIGIVNRVNTAANISQSAFHEIEKKAGVACLESLAAFQF